MKRLIVDENDILRKKQITQSAKNPDGAKEMTELRGLSLESSPVTCALSAIVQFTRSMVLTVHSKIN